MKNIYSLLIIVLFAACSNPNENDAFSYFEECKTSSIDTLVNHELFEIGFTNEWIDDSKFKMVQGIDIAQFDKDSVKIDFMLSVLPYQDYYLKRNPGIEYFSFERIQYKGLQGIHLIRNDLFPGDSTVYWRSEIKLYDTKKEYVYHMIFGKRNDQNIAPDWCVFAPIVTSFEAKN
ncbi:hypothetical protein SAMN05216474_0337 [Lishizhenia tianjinensis]|uniref:Lipoprotein n=1 Tax=Lishizhenia tianjinensis TaxID=477690 RepID=A0A1I6XP14_9FLAO|nr:hypothetical protein [Lishizhenia tianjinensis]SFT39817.1 hypothetical protein SAMN05216474_0337 [Lishizhenia tianjinensis]